MAGASEHTKVVKVVDANWAAASEDDDGSFSLMIVTDDDERHIVTPSPAATTALLTLCASQATLLWDPETRTLIAGGVVGSWFDDR